MMIRYRINLTPEELEVLTAIINKGKHSSQVYRSAYVLLNSAEGPNKVTGKQISEVLKIGMRTIDRIKKKFVEGGLDKALNRKPTTRKYALKLDGEVEAKLVQLCCSEPPEGYARWSLRLLADQMVALNYVESISYVSVGNLLKKTSLNLGKQKVG